MESIAPKINVKVQCTEDSKFENLLERQFNGNFSDSFFQTFSKENNVTDRKVALKFLGTLPNSILVTLPIFANASDEYLQLIFFRLADSLMTPDVETNGKAFINLIRSSRNVELPKSIRDDLLTMVTAYNRANYFQNLNLVGLDLTGLDFDKFLEVNFTGHNFDATGKLDLTGSDLRGAIVDKTTGLKAANLSRTNLSGLNLSHLDFTDVDFLGATLVATNLSNAILTRTDFTKAYLREANLSRTSLLSSKLKEADFTKAILTESKMFHADTDGAIFTDATLDGVMRFPGKNEEIQKEIDRQKSSEQLARKGSSKTLTNIISSRNVKK